MNPLTRLLSFLAPQKSELESTKLHHKRQLQQPTPASTASIGAHTYSKRRRSRRTGSSNDSASTDSVHQTPTPWSKVSNWQQTVSSTRPHSAFESTAESQRGRKRLLTPVSENTRGRKRRAPPLDDNMILADVPIPSVEESPVRSRRFLKKRKSQINREQQPKKTSPISCDELDIELITPGAEFSPEASVASEDLYTELTPSEHSNDVAPIKVKNNHKVRENDEDTSGIAKELRGTPNHKRPRREVTPPTPEQIKTLRATREAEAAALADQGWPAPDIALFRKLQLRGLEPLLPMYMAHDFAVLPAALFTTDESEAFIQPSGHAHPDSSTDFHHLRALQGLLQCGNRVRSCAEYAARNSSTWRAGEHWVSFAVENYRRWALADLGFSRAAIKQQQVPNNLALVQLASRRQLNATEMNKQTLAALLELEADWNVRPETAQREPPPFYALVMTGTMTAIVALRDATTRGEAELLRPIASFDWGDAAMDVWNAFAAAIVVVHARDALATALGHDGMAAVACDQAGADPEHDPDA